MDPNFYIWSLRWWPYAISHGLNPLYSRQIGAPVGFSLAWTTTAPALAVVLSPLTAAFGPITSLNLTLAARGAGVGLGGFVVARRLTGRFWPALLRRGRLWLLALRGWSHRRGQANLAVIMLLPLMVYLALLWRDGKLGRPLFVGLMAVAMTAEFYVFNEAFAEMTVLWAAGC